MRSGYSLNIVVSLWLAGAVGIARGGDLNPPVGPVAPTMKDLDDVEPRTAIRNGPVPIVLSAFGSYYLAENINALPGQHGIEITATHVTLDLNGFTIFGEMETGSLDGIHVTPEDAIVDIHDGSIRNFQGDGVDASLATNSRLHNIALINNGTPGGAGGPGGAGLRIGPHSVVSDCRVTNSGGIGIDVGAFSAIRNCTVEVSGEAGIVTTTSSTIEGCTVSGSQLDGISTFFACTVTRCTVLTSVGNGISVGDGSTVANCSAYFNNLSGISAAHHCTIADSSSHDNIGHGIVVFTACRVRNCTAGSNIGSGVAGFTNNSVSGTTCYDNSQDGVFAFGLGNLISDCMIAESGDDGADINEGLVIGSTLVDNTNLNITGGASVTKINNHTDGP